MMGRISAMSIADGNLVLQCMIDLESDKNCACLVFGGGPEMNTDISGPGVRISFYLQAYFLSLLSARSGSLDEITAALYTLVATNVAMVVASFILGFKTMPTMSLHDAIVVLYLLSLSWTSVFTSMPAYNRFVRSDRMLQAVSMVQSYLIFALALAVLIRAPAFGSTPHCNSHAAVVVFRQFPALNTGRFIASIVLAVIIISYTILSFTDYRRPVIRHYRSLKRWAKDRMHWEQRLKPKLEKVKCRIMHLGVWTMHQSRSRDRSIQLAVRGPSDPLYDSSAFRGKARENTGPDARKQRGRKRDCRTRQQIDSNGHLNARPIKTSKSYDSGVFGTLLVELIVITILWALFVMNTELLIVRNRFYGGGDGLGSDLWQFGQILPMFLVVLPLVNLIKVFRKLGFTRRYHRKRVHKHHMRKGCRETAPPRSRINLDVEEERARRFTSMASHADAQTFETEDMPYFLFSNEPRATGLGNQPTAHISLHSIHSTSSMPGSRIATIEQGEATQRHSDSFTSSLSLTSSSNSNN